MFWLSPHSISALPWYNKTRPTHLYKGLTVSNRVAFEQHHLSSKRFVHCWRVAGKSRRSVQQRTLWNFSRSRSSQTGAAPHDLITDNNKSLLLSYTIKNLFMQCRYLRSTVRYLLKKIKSTVLYLGDGQAPAGYHRRRGQQPSDCVHNSAGYPAKELDQRRFFWLRQNVTLPV